MEKVRSAKGSFHLEVARACGLRKSVKLIVSCNGLALFSRHRADATEELSIKASRRGLQSAIDNGSPDGAPFVDPRRLSVSISIS